MWLSSTGCLRRRAVFHCEQGWHVFFGVVLIFEGKGGGFWWVGACAASRGGTCARQASAHKGGQPTMRSTPRPLTWFFRPFSVRPGSSLLISLQRLPNCMCPSTSRCSSCGCHACGGVRGAKGCSGCEQAMKDARLKDEAPASRFWITIPQLPPHPSCPWTGSGVCPMLTAALGPPSQHALPAHPLVHGRAEVVDPTLAALLAAALAVVGPRQELVQVMRDLAPLAQAVLCHTAACARMCAGCEWVRGCMCACTCSCVHVCGGAPGMESRGLTGTAPALAQRWTQAAPATQP